MNATVTRLRAVGRSGARTAVELDDAPWAEVDTDVVLLHALRVGVRLSPDERQRILADDALARARRVAALQIKTKPRAEQELRRRLAERGFDESTVERAVSELVDAGEIDDARFAEDYARNRLKSGRYGPRRVRHELRQRGVDDELIERALAHHAETEPDRAEAGIERLIERRLRRLRPDDPRRRAKLAAALQRAGFEPDSFYPILDRVLREAKDSCDS